MKQQVKSLLLLVLVVVCKEAMAGVKSGTIGVIYFSDEKIAMAADSRAVFDDNRPPNDNQCKVATLGSQMIFTMAGAAEYTPDPFGPIRVERAWNSLEEAKAAYSEESLLLGDSGDITERTARKWGTILAMRWNFVYSFAPEKVPQNSHNGFIVAGVFGGRDPDGKLVLFQTKITIEPMRTVSPVTSVTESITCPQSNICAIGEPQAVMEFVTLSSERARVEASQWAKQESTMKPEDRAVRKLIRLVDLTMAEPTIKAVGGPIDAVEINRDGIVRWFQQKEECGGRQ